MTYPIIDINPAMTQYLKDNIISIVAVVISLSALIVKTADAKKSTKKKIAMSVRALSRISIALFILCSFVATPYLLYLKYHNPVALGQFFLMIIALFAYIVYLLHLICKLEKRMSDVELAMKINENEDENGRVT